MPYDARRADPFLAMSATPMRHCLHDPFHRGMLAVLDLDPNRASVRYDLLAVEPHVEAAARIAG